MKLIFHAGLPKTGSSFLQSFLFDKKSEMEQNNIYFPVGQNLNEDNIYKAGNAKHISGLIHKDNLDEILREFTKYREEADKKNCTSILLSHEGLYNSLPVLFESNKFKSWFATSEFEQMDIILILRNPYDLLLSLYKQKCRTGIRIKPIQFLKKSKTLDYIYNILELPKTTNLVKLHCINYDTHKNSLKFVFINSLFKAANIQQKQFNFEYTNKKINRSLTLNQIKFIQFIALIHKGIAVRLSRILKKFHFFKKSPKSVDNFKVLVRNSYENKIRILVNQMNLNLPDSDQIKIS